MSSKLSMAILFMLPAYAATSETPDIILSTETLLKKSDEYFMDDSISVDLDGNESTPEEIEYSYTRIGPPGTCEKSDCTPETSPTITFIVHVNGAEHPVNYLCASVGIYKTKTKGLKDIFCGPKTRLIWSGEEYKSKDGLK
jgi:hypothetical protein